MSHTLGERMFDGTDGMRGRAGRGGTKGGVA